jgi:diguanylate cyclase (GGDEF)-like protein/PAS domain S-box-containing protein
MLSTAADAGSAIVMRQVVRRGNDTKRPSSRDRHFWLNSAAAVLLTLGVVAAIVGLHDWSSQSERAAQSIGSLRTAIAVEQEGILDSPRLTVTRQAAANQALVLVQATETSTVTRGMIAGMTAIYQLAASDEISALLRGDVLSADTLNVALGDPAFTALDGKLATVSEAEASSAARGVTIAFVASIGIVTGSGVVTLLFGVFARRRRAAIAAQVATSAALVSEARVTLTREETFRSLFDENPQAMMVTRLPALITEDGNLTFLAVNNAAIAMYGHNRAEFLALTLAEIRPAEDRALLRSNLHAMRGGRTHFDGIRHEIKNGGVLDVEIDTRETIFEGESAMIICSTDVTDRTRLQRELEHQAFHDALTGLPNRSLFGDRLEHAHQRLARGTGCYAVLMLDLDNFKTVNDGLGHAAGDALLLEVSRRLTTGIRAGDTAARLGGDEFAILLEDLADPAAASRAAEGIRELLRAPFAVAGRFLTVSATIGVATSSGGGAATDVVRNADAALYAGKADGKDRHAVFSEDMHVTAIERLTLEQDLRSGIGRGELVLMYQPKVDARTGHMAGVEALVRWNHPFRGLIAPDQFIPIAEQSGLINDLDTWVLSAACRQAQAWATSAVGAVPVAVNVSGRNLVSCGLIDRVLAALKQTGLDPRLLELEVTESAAVPQQGEALALLQGIRDLGVRIAIDDFGTGYSVLSRLQGFPVDTLKIDLSFVRSIVSEHVSAPIVDAMIAMGLSLGLKIVAEGVETEVQRAYLVKRHCTELQGYLISRPITADEVVARFRPAALAAVA